MAKLRVGVIGWRGMVGSVLMQRMREENDFALIEPFFFTTSNIGGVAPAEAGGSPLRDAKDIAELIAMDVLLTCQNRIWYNVCTVDSRCDSHEATVGHNSSCEEKSV